MGRKEHGNRARKYMAVKRVLRNWCGATCTFTLTFNIRRKAQPLASLRCLWTAGVLNLSLDINNCILPVTHERHNFTDIFTTIKMKTVCLCLMEPPTICPTIMGHAETLFEIVWNIYLKWSNTTHFSFIAYIFLNFSNYFSWHCIFSLFLILQHHTCLLNSFFFFECCI